jgi:hypothetical protein
MERMGRIWELVGRSLGVGCCLGLAVMVAISPVAGDEGGPVPDTDV